MAQASTQNSLKSTDDGYGDYWGIGRKSLMVAAKELPQSLSVAWHGFCLGFRHAPPRQLLCDRGGISWANFGRAIHVSEDVKGASQRDRNYRSGNTQGSFSAAAIDMLVDASRGNDLTIKTPTSFT